MSSLQQLLETIQNSSKAYTLSELSALYPKVPRRTLQRWISERLVKAIMKTANSHFCQLMLPLNESNSY